jgi:hypothetical protein
LSGPTPLASPPATPSSQAKLKKSGWPITSAAGAPLAKALALVHPSTRLFAVSAT